MIRLALPGNYCGALPDGGRFVETPTGIDIGGGTVPIPAGGALALVGARINGQLYLACQGHDDGQCWLWSVSGWRAVGPTHGVRPCAFGSDSLFFATSGNTYRRIRLATGEASDHSAAVGSQGIRYVNGEIPVFGDQTLFDGTVHEFIDRGDVRAGQGHNGGYLLNGRLLEPGDCQFGQFERDGDHLAVGIVKFFEGQAVLYYLSRSEVEALPFATPDVPAPKPDPKPEPEPTPVSLIAPNQIETVRRVMREHPEINVLDENQRARIIDFCCMYLNAGGTKWGRKSRNAQGTDLNTDALTYLRPDGLFEIYDAIRGSDPNPKNDDGTPNTDLGRFATWDAYGPFKPGENGYWVEAPDANGHPGGQPDTPPAVDLSGILARLDALERELVATHNDINTELHALDDRVKALENKPAVTLPKLRVKGRTKQSVYHSHDLDLEVVADDRA